MKELTDKEKEAINTLFHLEHINTYLDLYKNHNVIIESDTILKWKNATQTVLSMLKEKDKELEKKDKIIDEMAEWIEKHTKYYDEDGCYCEVEKDICNKTIDCKDCIKQYFERKVENGN